MKFVPHPQHTRSLGAPIGWDQSKVHCGSLSIQDDTINGYHVMKSQWEFEGAESAYMLLGGKVELCIWSDVHPPVSLIPVPPVQPITATDIENAISGLRMLAQRLCLEIK